MNTPSISIDTIAQALDFMILLMIIIKTIALNVWKI